MSLMYSETNEALYQFRKMLDQGYLAQILCIIAQLFITVIVTIKIYQNRQEFPIKQLGPITTIAALQFFFFTNIASFLAKIIQTQRGYFIRDKQAQQIQCGQCRLYQHPQMVVLAMAYGFFREIPFVIFNVKIVRVSLCYFGPFFRRKNIPGWVKTLFGSDLNMLILSVVHTAIITGINYLIFANNVNEHYCQVLFGFFCPKRPSLFEYLVLTERFIFLCSAYFLSLFTYQQLDFKRFLIVLFLISNTEILLRFFANILEISDQTYHQFYYHSMLSAMGGTFMMAYFSRFKQIVNALPEPSIIQTWESFCNVSTGMQIIKCFAKYSDINLNKDLYTKALQAFLQTDSIMKAIVDMGKLSQNQDEKRKLINSRMGNILQIIDEIEIPKLKASQLKNKNSAGEIGISDIRVIHHYLSTFCEAQIYKRWKNTFSYKNYKQQCENNTLISHKLELLKISFG